MFERQNDKIRVQTQPLRSVLYYCQKSETQQIIELQSLFDTMLRLRVSELSVHPVEPGAAGLLPPTVSPQGRRLSVVLTRR